MKHKICIYAIARNEEQFVDRFCDAAAEADYIAVLDTGSTDRTVEKLSDRGVIVRQMTIEPWRFDVARNLSLLLIPRDTDLCVCVDLDEVLLPGWRAALEKAWTEDAETGTYRCICSRNADGSEGTVFLREKIHRPKCATWRYPVHEVLVPSDGRPFFRCVNVEGMAAEHLPDERKSRAQYLPLLELAAQEAPQDARCAHYLGREYLYRGMFRKAAEELKRHLTLPSAVWDEERAASMRYLSACMHALGDERSAMCWAMRAIAEVPEQRENWYEAEKAAYRAENWEGVVYYGQKALRITSKSRSAINEAEAWGAAPWDLLSIGLWHTGDIRGAAEAASTALSLCRSERIEANLRLFQERLGEA